MRLLVATGTGANIFPSGHSTASAAFTAGVDDEDTLVFKVFERFNYMLFLQ